ncbi:Spy/CpxP family protein refolding chaperone [Candidatus Omnitrophota bacterium]
MPGFDGPKCQAKGAGFEGSEGKKGKDHEKYFQEMIDKMDLSKEQREQFKTHREEQKAQMKELKDALKEKRKALHAELKNYDSDESTIKSTVAELKTIQGQMLDQKVNSFLGMKKILTPEQFQKMNELRDEKRKQKHEKMQGYKKDQV